MTTSLGVAELIRRARIGRGLSDVQAAGLVGLTVHEYSDIEQHDDELETAVSLSSAIKICSVLGIDLASALKMEKAGYPRISSPGKYIAEKRREKGISTDALSELIGFEPSVVSRLESDSDFGSSLPIRVLREIEEALSMAKGDLVFAIWR